MTQRMLVKVTKDSSGKYIPECLKVFFDIFNQSEINSMVKNIDGIEVIECKGNFDEHGSLIRINPW